MICPSCHKDIDPDDFCAGTCDDCFDKHIEQVHADIDIFDEHSGKCCVCGGHVSGWIIREIDGVKSLTCWPSCQDRLPGPIHLKIDPGKENS